MGTSLVIAQLRKRRERVVYLNDEKTKSVTFLRPTEVDMQAMLVPDPTDPTKRFWKVEVDDVRKHVIGWDGITMADLLGAEFAAPDPVPFDSELWSEVCSDEIVFINRVADEILDSVVKHVLAKAEARKNSKPA